MNTTGILASAAFLNAGRMAVGAMGMAMMPSTFWEMAISIWFTISAGSIPWGPTYWALKPSFLAVSSKPARATSHTGWAMSGVTKMMFSSFLAALAVSLALQPTTPKTTTTRTSATAIQAIPFLMFSPPNRGCRIHESRRFGRSAFRRSPWPRA